MPSPPVPTEDAYLAIVPVLKDAFPAFTRSSEYRPVDDCDDLPGVILAAFARYLVALSSEASTAPELGRAIASINLLYGSDDPRIREAIRDEFIEAFDGSWGAVEQLRPLLSEPLAEAFERVLR